jgi:Domain of unknown function (DUF3332)
MKNFKSIISSILIGSTLFLSMGCFGGFNLTKVIYKWNGGVSESNLVKSLVMWGLIIIPVYEIVLILDFIIFNLIEFWGGSNPISMKAGDIETQYAHVKGNDYFYEVTKNQYKITQLSGKHEGRVRIMRFDENTKTWYFKGGVDAEKALMTFTENEMDQSITRVYTEKGYANLRANKLYSNDQLANIFEHADTKFMAVNDR